MSELLLVNPRKRRSHKNPRAKAAAPKRRRTRRAAPSVVNTVKRRARSASRSIARRARSRGTRHTMGGIGGVVKKGLIGGAGAVLVDVVASKLPLPVSLQSGIGGAAAKVAIAIGTGMLLGKVINKQTAHELAAGSITVTGYNLVKSLVGGMVGLNAVTDINGVGFYSPANVPDDYTVAGMGAYLSGADEMGEGIYPAGNISAYDNQYIY